MKSIGKELRAVDDLVGRIWPSNERPAESQEPIVPHELKYAGETVAEKLTRVAAEMQRSGASLTVISALDEVAWLFNLRGADIPNNPFFKSYAIVHVDFSTTLPQLFLNTSRLATTDYPPNVQVFQYAMFWSRLNVTANNPSINKIWVSPSVSQAISSLIPSGKVLVPLANSPVQRTKVRKNPVERRGMRDCQVRDAVARMKHLGWLEQQLTEGKSINETQSSEQLLVYQKQQDRFRLPSFGAISASGDRAAVVHYSAKPATARQITTNQVYLLDVRERASAVLFVNRRFSPRLAVSILTARPTSHARITLALLLPWRNAPTHASFKVCSTWPMLFSPPVPTVDQSTISVVCRCTGTA